MHVTLQDWKNGWCGIEVALSAVEIDRLIELLRKLQEAPEQHFHISSDYKGPGGVGDIEVFIKPDTEPDNMFLTGEALNPGAAI